MLQVHRVLRLPRVLGVLSGLLGLGFSVPALGKQGSDSHKVR